MAVVDSPIPRCKIFEVSDKLFEVLDLEPLKDLCKRVFRNSENNTRVPILLTWFAPQSFDAVWRKESDSFQMEIRKIAWVKFNNNYFSEAVDKSKIGSRHS